MAFSITISLKLYLENGGKIENISPGYVWSLSSFYKNNIYPIRVDTVKIEDRGEKNSNGDTLYYLVYEDGTECSDVSSWIEVKVMVELV